MSNKKKYRLKKTAIFIMIFIFGVTAFWGAAPYIFGRKAEAAQSDEIMQSDPPKTETSEAVSTETKEQKTDEAVSTETKEQKTDEAVSTETKEQKTNETVSTETNEAVPTETKEVQTKEEVNEQSDNAFTLPRYITYSENSSIEIIVNYLSPAKKERDILTFEILIDTHSVDLTKYVDIAKYVELRTDEGVIVSDGFEWKVENGEGHHISGILKIKNEIEGKPVINSDTKSFKLIFKNVGDIGEREHLYEGDNLR